jgi:hypothetical protein
VVVIVAWFAILFTGSYPRGMFGFVDGGHPMEHPGDRLHADPRHRLVSPFRLALGSATRGVPRCREHQAVRALLARRGWVIGIDDLPFTRGFLLPDFALRNRLV